MDHAAGPLFASGLPLPAFLDAARPSPQRPTAAFVPLPEFFSKQLFASRRLLFISPPHRRVAQRCGPLLGNSSTVERRTLTPLILVRIQVPQPFSLLQFNNLASCRQRREYPHAAPPQGAFGDVKLPPARSRFLLLPAACPRLSSRSPWTDRDIPVLKDQRAKNSQSASRAPVHCHGEAIPDAGRRRR